MNKVFIKAVSFTAIIGMLLTGFGMLISTFFQSEEVGYDYDGRQREEIVESNQENEGLTKDQENDTEDVMSNQDIKGLEIEDVVVGTGKELQSGQTATFHYKGMLEDGTEFDSSYSRNEPFQSVVGGGRLIQGWEVGIPGMKEGGKRTLVISSDLAYGDNGIPGTIPGGATLTFEVELISVDS